jgi:hypothetical protein
LFAPSTPQAPPDGKSSCNPSTCEESAGESQNRSLKVDGELKSKPAIDSTGGGICAGSDNEEVSGVATSLAVLEFEDRRIRFEDVESDEGVREDGDGESCSDDDDDIFDAAGVIARCAMLVPFGTRLGSGAIFF